MPKPVSPLAICALLVAGAALAAPAEAQTRPHALFGDHMVLQCEKPIRVWGSSGPGASVSVSLWNAGVAGEPRLLAEGAGLADDRGAWDVRLAAQPPGGPYELRIAGESDSVFRDVWLGEVWICSGQSNMEWPVRQAKDAEAEIAGADHPGIRLFQTPRRAAPVPETHVEAEWRTCSPESVAGFSAVGYSFGRALHERIDRPVGLIQAAWGGTPAEAWTAPASLRDDPDFAEILVRKPRHGSWAPSALFHGMIAPLTRYGIRGVIWYQGESNADRAWQYRRLFPAMIRSWREAFRQGDIPFLFVQLANFKARAEQPGESEWAELREAQTRALSLPRTGMAVTIDIGEADDIHPRNKQEVGRRLALAAMPAAYGKEVASSGPRYRAMEIDGSRVRVFFRAVADGLRTSDGEEPRGFALAGADRVFHWASAVVEGRSVVVESPEVQEPVAVRYAWADNPDANLANAAGLPAAPFRTDDWPGVTIGRR